MLSADISIHPASLPARVDRNGIPVREDVLYTDAKGRDKTRLHKRSDKALEDLGDLLRRVLEPNETVFYIAIAQAMPGVAAQFFGGGWHAYSIPKTLLLFTERRLIAVRLRRKMTGWEWNRGIRTVRWGDLERSAPGGFFSRRLTLKFQNGERQGYWRFARADLSKVRLLIGILRPNGVGETTAARGMVSRCPSCLAQLASRSYECRGCGTRFKDEKNLWWRGIAIPGGASLYVGASGIGWLRAAFETLLIAGIVVAVSSAVRQTNREAALKLMGGAELECAVLILDKLSAIAVSLPQVRDFIPAK